MERARWRFVGPKHEVILTPRGDHGPTRGDALDADAAVRALTLLVASEPTMSFARLTLAEVARHVSRTADLTRSLKGTALSVVCEALRRGVLVASRAPLLAVPAHASDLDPDAGVGAPLLTSDARRTWIEIELTDMEGNPMVGERYWIKLPDGTVREGALDRNGRAYYGDLDAGSCEIRWPDRDDQATVAAPPVLNAAPAERTWVEIELTDMEGDPVASERYSITLPDGTVREGCLDKNGRARFADLVPGTCLVRWPDLDDEAQLATLDPTVAQPEDEAPPRAEATAPAEAPRRAATTRSPQAEAQAEAQAQTLREAAQDGVPFCAECERARRAQAAAAAAS